MTDISVNKKVIVEPLANKFVPYRPIFEPYNEAAHTCLQKIIDNLADIPVSAVSKAKYQLAIGSFLAAAQSANTSDDGVITWPQHKSNWGHYSIGHQIITKVRKKLEEADFIWLVEGSGKRIFEERDKDSTERAEFVDMPSMYHIDEQLEYLDGFSDSEWIETSRPPIMVAKYEEDWQRHWRKANGIGSPKYNVTTLKAMGKPYSNAVVQINALQRLWRQHPLQLPVYEDRTARYSCSVTRTFHRGKLDAGGRMYGSWTMLNQRYDKARLRCSIDGEYVAHIDIAASQPTLFSSLLGIRINCGDKWTDAYKSVLTQIPYFYDKETDDTRRNKVKSIIMEMIGTGNCLKEMPSEANDYSWDAEQGEWLKYQEAVLAVFPALYKLHRATGMDGAGFLSFHESEMLIKTIENLAAQGIAAYPMHDCILIAGSKRNIGVEVFQATVKDYILTHCRDNNRDGDIDLTVPLTVELRGREKEYVGGYYS